MHIAVGGAGSPARAVHDGLFHGFEFRASRLEAAFQPCPRFVVAVPGIGRRMPEQFFGVFDHCLEILREALLAILGGLIVHRIAP